MILLLSVLSDEAMEALVPVLALLEDSGVVEVLESWDDEEG